MTLILYQNISIIPLVCAVTYSERVKHPKRKDQDNTASQETGVRNLLVDVYQDLGAEVFLLYTLAALITKLATITYKDLFFKLRA